MRQNLGLAIPSWLLALVGNQVLEGARWGWNYWTTRKQIQQQIQSQGVQVTPTDISDVAGNITQQAGPNLKVSRQDLEKYLYGMVYGTGGVQQPPRDLFWQPPKEKEKAKMPDWAWIAFGVLGFFVLKPMLTKGD